MHDRKRVLALTLCAVLLLSLFPGVGGQTRAAEESGWTLRYDPAAYGGGRILAELYSAARKLAPEIGWTEGSGFLRADRSASELFADGGDWYAVVQYDSGSGDGSSLSDEQVLEEFDKLLEAMGESGGSDMPYPPPAELDSSEVALAWYELALTDTVFCNYWWDETGEVLPSRDELVEELRSWLDEEDDPSELEQMILYEVEGYADEYRLFYGAEEGSGYSGMTPEQKRMMVEYYIRYPAEAPDGYIPPSSGSGEGSRVSVVKLTGAQKTDGLTVGADFFDACVPLTVTTPALNESGDMGFGISSAAAAAVYFLTEDLAIPAHIDPPSEEEEYGEEASYLEAETFFGAGETASAALGGTVPRDAPLLVLPGQYLVTTSIGAGQQASDSRALADWETVQVREGSGGSVDFTRSRTYRTVTVTAAGTQGHTLQGLTVSFGGGDLKTASVGAELCTMDYGSIPGMDQPGDGGYDDYDLDEYDLYDWYSGGFPGGYGGYMPEMVISSLRLKAGSYGSASFVVTEAGSETGAQLSSWWSLENLGAVTADRSFTLPSLLSEYEGELVFTTEAGAGVPFTAGEKLVGTAVLTSGAYRLLGAAMVRISGSVSDLGFEVVSLRTQAALEDGASLTPAGGVQGLSFSFTAPAAAQNVTASVTLSGLGFSAEVQGFLQSGSGGDTTAPAVPTGLAARAEEDGVSFSWNPNGEGDLEAYRLYLTDGAGNALSRVASFKKNAATGYAECAAEWNAAPWYFALSALDRYGNESGLSAPIRVTPLFYGSGEVTAAAGSLGDDGFTLPEEGEGSLRLCFRKGEDVQEQNCPDSIRAVLCYRDLSGRPGEKEAELSGEDGYTAVLPIPGDAAVLERVVFTAGERALGACELGSRSVLARVQILLPDPEDYALAYAFDGAWISTGRYFAPDVPLAGGEGVLTGILARDQYSLSMLTLRIGELSFNLSKALMDFRTEGDSFAVPASDMPEMIRVKVDLDWPEAAPYLAAWFDIPGGSGDEDEAVLAKLSMPRDDRSVAYVERPGREYGTVHLQLLADEELELSLEDPDGLFSGGLTFVSGSDYSVSGTVRRKDLAEYMFLDVLCGQNGDKHLQADLDLCLTDARGKTVTARWYWMTHQLETGALTAGESYRVSLPEEMVWFLPRAQDGSELSITARKNGDNLASRPTLILGETVQAGLKALFRTDPASDPEGGTQGRVVRPEELAVYYYDAVLKDWISLPGELRWASMTTADYAVGGTGVVFLSVPIPRGQMDENKGLRLIPGSQARVSDLVNVNEDLHVGMYNEAGAVRLLGGQSIDTFGKITMHKTTYFNSSYNEEYLDRSTVQLYFGEEDVDRGSLPTVIEGLKLADSPRVELYVNRVTEPQAMTFLLRDRAGENTVYRYDSSMGAAGSGTLLKVSLDGLPYGSYDLLLLLGSGVEQTELERRFRDGEAINTLTIPRNISGCVMGPCALNEANACISLDLPAAPIDPNRPGIQSLSNNCDRSAALAGDRVTYTVLFHCVPGGNEDARTVLLTAEGLLEVDSVACSLTASDGRQLAASVSADKKSVTVPADNEILYGRAVVSGRISHSETASHATLLAEVYDEANLDRTYSRASCQRERFQVFIPTRTGTNSAVLTGRYGPDLQLTLEVASQKHPERTSTQCVTVSQYGYWKHRLELPEAGEEADTYRVRILDGQEELTCGCVAYEPVRILPALIRLSYRGENDLSEITGYPGRERDFADLNRSVMVMGMTGMVTVEIEFDDTDPDAWGLTEARRVMEPALAVHYHPTADPLYFDFYPVDSLTYTYDNLDLDLRVEDIPYATRYRLTYPACYFGEMTLEYGLLPAKGDGTLPERVAGVPFEGSGRTAEAIHALNDSLAEPYTYQGTYSCEFRNSSFDGSIKGGDLGTDALPEDLVLMGPYTNRNLSFRLEETWTVTPLREDQVAAAIAGYDTPEDALCRLDFTGSDSCIGYADASAAYYIRPELDPETDRIRLWFEAEVVRHTLVDAARVPEADATLMAGPGGFTWFGVEERENQLIGGALMDVSSEALDHIAREGGKLALQNAEAAKALKGVMKGVGTVANVAGVGITLLEEGDKLEKSQAELSKLRSEIEKLIGKSYHYYCSKLTCEEGGASAIKKELWAIYNGVWEKLSDSMFTSKVNRVAEGVLINGAVSATGFIPVPGVGTVIGYIHDGNKELADENMKYADESAMWKICYQAEAEMKKAFARYDPTACEDKPEDTGDLNITTTEDLLARRERYKGMGGGAVSVDFRPCRILDPSGVVYEGMLSNPLEGVTVSIEYKDGDSWKLWTEAPDYNDQQAEYITGVGGYYKWDVPDGVWRVKYFKEGYNGGEAVYSGEMTVPPVWLDVNRNMTDPGEFSAEAAAGDTGVTLRFTKPVLTADLEKVTLLRDGHPVETAFRPLLEENGLAMSVFAVCAVDPSSVYAVRVNGVRSYAGAACSFQTPVQMTETDPNKCAPVTADLESGITVAAGRSLTLTCATEDAEIWYTTDGSCPCVEDNPARLRYTGPISIARDTYIIAYSRAEGREDSATRAFIYFCAAPGERILGRVSAEDHAVTAAVWVDLTGLSGLCDVILVYSQGGRYVGLTAERGLDASGESLSLCKRFTSARELKDVSVKVMVLRSGAWQPLLPAAEIYP